MFTANEHAKILNAEERQNNIRTEKYTMERILKEAFDHLKEVIPVEGVRYKLEARVDDTFIDAIVEFDELLEPYHLLVKNELRQETIAAIAILKERIPKPFLLVTKHVTPPIAERLKKQNIQFLDTAGNMFIVQNDPGVFINIVGYKDRGIATFDRVRLFRNAGLRVLFVLLCNRHIIRQPYREIAKMAGVALGTVGNTITDLREYGYISKLREGTVLNRRKVLIDRWVDAYATELRPKLNPRRFTTELPKWWKNKNFQAIDVYLGGEVAAEELTHYLHPKVATVYIGDDFPEFARALRLRKDDQGEVNVLDKFWHALPDDNTPHGIAPPLLVYADLHATGGARNIEVAEMIREQFLEK